MKLEYFNNIDVPMYMTRGVKENIPNELCQDLIALAFQRKAKLDKKGIETAYFQLFTIKTKKYNDMFTKCDIIMEQEQPDYVTEHHKIVLGNFMYDGRIYLIESWNGKTENVTPEDHYITLLLPEEY
ncbi:MAG: DUF960 domain-containing protein [Lachnospiraceae bacterium]